MTATSSASTCPASTRGQRGPGLGLDGRGRRLAWPGHSGCGTSEPTAPAPRGGEKGPQDKAPCTPTPTPTVGPGGNTRRAPSPAACSSDLLESVQDMLFVEKTQRADPRGVWWAAVCGDPRGSPTCLCSSPAPPPPRGPSTSKDLVSHSLGTAGPFDGPGRLPDGENISCHVTARGRQREERSHFLQSPSGAPEARGPAPAAPTASPLPASPRPCTAPGGVAGRRQEGGQRGAFPQRPCSPAGAGLIRAHMASRTSAFCPRPRSAFPAGAGGPGPGGGPPPPPPPPLPPPPPPLCPCAQRPGGVWGPGWQGLLAQPGPSWPRPPRLPSCPAPPWGQCSLSRSGERVPTPPSASVHSASVVQAYPGGPQEQRLPVSPLEVPGKLGPVSAFVLTPGTQLPSHSTSHLT